MDAVLDTNNKTTALAMRDVCLFSDGSGGRCVLEVVSQPFTAEVEFFFDVPTLDEFIQQLQVVHATLSGEAKLGEQHEEPYLALIASGHGHITVKGVLATYSEHSQKLEFSFETDQTSLPSFIGELEAISYAHAQTG